MVPSAHTVVVYVVVVEGHTWPIKDRILEEKKKFYKSMPRYFRYPFVSTNFPSSAALILRV